MKILSPYNAESETAFQHDYRWSNAGLYIPRKSARAFPTCVDLFAGAGGFSLGFLQAGFEVVAACDHDFHAAVTYMMNLGHSQCEFHYLDGPEQKQKFNAHLEKQHKYEKRNKLPLSVSGLHHENLEIENPNVPGVKHFFLGDIHNLTGNMILEACGLERGELDCVIGGPPCQGFSRSGHQDPDDPRSMLVFEFARIILELNPKTFCMEEVPDFLNMVMPNGIPFVDAFIQVISDGDFAGYNALRRAFKNVKAKKPMLIHRGSQTNIDTTKKKPAMKKSQTIGQGSLFKTRKKV